MSDDDEKQEICDNPNTLIAILCIVLFIMTAQSVILGCIYYRWKRPGRPNRHRPAGNNPQPSAPTQEAPPEYATVDKLRNGTNSSDPIYMNNMPKFKKNVPQSSMAVQNALYNDIEITRKESPKRGKSVAIDNDMYLESNDVSKRMEVLKKLQT